MIPPYVTIGEHTYSGPINFFRWGTEQISIGRYCSISQGVSILAGGNHNTANVSTYPFDTMLLKNGQPERSYDADGDIQIGSDVWIGYGASILGSCSIGNGAVIAANATVFTDIPPYAIAVGNPARVLKYRHSGEIVSALLRIAWWDWPEETIRERVEHFYWPIEKFVREYDRELAKAA